MKILHINSVCGVTGTGRIVTDLCKEALMLGHQCKAAYGEHKYNNKSNDIETIQIGSELDCQIHGVMTRLLDWHGFGSILATKKFLKEVDLYKPDIIHLHNLHGYYINLELLFDYIKRNNVKIVWTLHDCWAFTGHCTHFDYIKCNKWKEMCQNCPQKKNYPSSILVDNSKNNYIRKKKAFTGVGNMKIAVPSKWLEQRVLESFLNEYPIEVVYNGIDLSVYKPVTSDFRSKYKIENKTMLLGVANIWGKRKGFDDFLELGKLLEDNYVIVLVGVKEELLNTLPSNFIAISHTDSPQELAGIYATADFYINPSVEETFSLTTAEAIACGTLPIVYKDTACEEVVNASVGKVVDRNPVAIKSALIESLKEEKVANIEQYAQIFSKEEFSINIMNLYLKE